MAIKFEPSLVRCQAVWAQDEDDDEWVCNTLMQLRLTGPVWGPPQGGPQGVCARCGAQYVL